MESNECEVRYRLYERKCCIKSYIMKSKLIKFLVLFKILKLKFNIKILY